MWSAGRRNADALAPWLGYRHLGRWDEGCGGQKTGAGVKPATDSGSILLSRREF